MGNEWLETGILELYCLGVLSAHEEENVRKMLVLPEVRAKLNNIQAMLEAYAEDHAVEPPHHLTEHMDAVFENLEKERDMQLANLPVINRFSDYQSWLKLLENDIPETLKEDRIIKVLTHTPRITQMLVVSATDFEDEVHTDELESFLILKGCGDCTVDGTVLHMKAGDFMEIPLHLHHDVKIHAPFAVAIMQRIAV